MLSWVFFLYLPHPCHISFSLEEENQSLKQNLAKIINEKQNAEKQYNEIKKKNEDYEKQISLSKLQIYQLENETKNKYEQEILLLKNNNAKLINDFNEKQRQYQEQQNKLIEDYNNKIIQLQKENKEYMMQVSKIQHSVCQTTHHGIKCQQCFKQPIIGYRYKCSVCNNYNLCQDCEEKNSINGSHQHCFLKIRNELNENFNNGNYINDNNNDNIINYSYKILSTKFITYIQQGIKAAKIPICLKNDGSSKWPENKTKLIVDQQNSMIVCDDIILKPLNPGEQYNYDIIFNNLDYYGPREYKTYFYFNVNGKNYGEKLCLSVVINPNQNNNNNNNNIVEQFKNKYNLKNGRFTDEFIFNKLIENKNNFEAAFFNLYFS